MSSHPGTGGSGIRGSDGEGEAKQPPPSQSLVVVSLMFLGSYIDFSFFVR